MAATKAQRPWNGLFTLVLITILLVLSSVNCTIVHLKNHVYTSPITSSPSTSKKANHFYTIERHAMITKEDMSSHRSPLMSLLLQSNPNTVVSFDLDVSHVVAASNNQNRAQTKYLRLYFTLLHSDDMHLLSSRVCRRTNDNNNSQNELNFKFPLSQISSQVFVDSVDVKWNEKFVPYHRSIDITKSGVYYLVIANCNEPRSVNNENDASLFSLVVSGRITFLNAHGHLDGEQYGFLIFYGTSCVLLFALGAVWFMWHIRYYMQNQQQSDMPQRTSVGGVSITSMLPIQLWITLVYMISLIECISWYIHFYEWNYSLSSSPKSRHFLYSVSILLTLGRRTLCRMLLLLMAMGYGGYLKFQMPDNSKKFMFVVFSLSFFIVSCVAEIVKQVSQDFNISIKVVSLVQTPVNLLDTIGIAWIWTELRSIILTLRNRKQTNKLRTYRSVQWIFILNVLIGIGWLAYEFWTGFIKPSFDRQVLIPGETRENLIINDLMHSKDKQWATNWIMSAFWNVSYMFMLLCFMFLWRPQNVNQELFDITSAVSSPSRPEEEEWLDARDDANTIIHSTSAKTLESASLLSHHERKPQETNPIPKKKKNKKFSMGDIEDEYGDMFDKELQDLGLEDPEEEIVVKDD